MSSASCDWLLRYYSRSLVVVLSHRAMTLFVLAGVLALTVVLYIKSPKGFFPPTTPV